MHGLSVAFFAVFAFAAFAAFSAFRAAAGPRRPVPHALRRGALPAALRGLALCLLLSAAAGAQPADAGDTGEAGDLDSARSQLEGMQKQLRDDGDISDADLATLRGQALSLQLQTGHEADEIGPHLNDVQARLGQLGAKPATGTEAPDVAAQRAALEKTRTQLDARVKLARLLAVESGQLAEHASTQRRARFNARLGERTASILATQFWRELHDGLSHDRLRLQQLGHDLAGAARASGAGVWTSVLAGALAIVAACLWAGRRLAPFIATRVPSGRLRRSLHALLQVALYVALPGGVAYMLLLGLTWAGTLAEAEQTWLAGVFGAVLFCSYVAGLGRALLSPKRPTWRLPPVPDRVAERMRIYPLLLGIFIFVGWQGQRLGALVNTGLATAVATNCLFALALGLLMVHAGRRGERLRREAKAAHEAGPEMTRPLWLSIVLGTSWILLVLSVIAIVIGYVALGSFVVTQVAWVMTVLGSAYLLSVVVDDACTTWLASAPPAQADAAHEPKLRDQAAVLLSGIGRLLVVLVAIVFIAAPFGQGPLELMQRTDQIRSGVTIGEIPVRPGMVLLALLVFGLGLLGVRALQRWLHDRYLPTTTLDAGMRQSVTTLLGYVGVVVVVALALSAVGLGLERIAWVASALSVGIGFGLQAVVSNFVSGLILLAERPVKVGDWVSLGGVEGDIRRINVRATEIQMGDRSTVIVPNSEFITKTVRNITLANPLGLVQIKLPMPLDTDVERVRTIMLEAFQRHADIVDAPAPSVQLDTIDASGIVFNATGFVGSPRQAYGAKSALLFELLGRLREAGLPMSKPATMLLRDGAASPSGAVPGAPAFVPSGPSPAAPPGTPPAPPASSA